MIIRPSRKTYYYGDTHTASAAVSYEHSSSTDTHTHTHVRVVEDFYIYNKNRSQGLAVGTLGITTNSSSNLACATRTVGCA